jgi:hypothetical protein
MSPGLLITFPFIDNLQGYKVSITAALLSNIGALFFAAPNTDQLIAISAYHLITPVLVNVSEQQHLIGWRPADHRHSMLDDEPPNALYRDQPRFKGATTLDGTMAGWRRPCGGSCPSIWRAAEGLRGFAQIKWGGLDDLGDSTDPTLDVIGHSRLTFRFGTECNNVLCSNSDKYVEAHL